MSADRRKEPRHVVVGFEATINGVPSAIVDISKTGVRLLRPEGCTLAASLGADRGSGTDAFPVEIVFALAGRSASSGRSYRVRGEIVRSTPGEIVCRYEPPIPRWEAVLRSFDTFAQTKLVRL